MLGIIVAEEKELIEIKNILNVEKEEIIYGNKFYLCNKYNKKIILVKSNVGKVNAARICQILIDKFDIKRIINIGTCGSVNNELNIGDVVVATKLVQYDFDATAFGRELGEIENTGKYIECDKDLLNLFKNAKKAIIASGDKFIYDRKEKDRIRKLFNADCIEMEGASIAQVCFLDKIPFIVIRAVTDKLDGSSKIDFEEFLTSSSKKAAELLNNVLEKI